MLLFSVLLAWQATLSFGDVPANLPSTSFDSSKVTFFLYRINNTGNQIYVNDLTKLTAASFDSTKDTYMFIHGYGGNHNKGPPQAIKDGILSATDANVILVDYAPYSFPYRYLNNNSRMIGATCASLIDFLVEQGGLKLTKLSIVGHSFGAHISGFTANKVKGSVPHIVGLDPAGPLFRNANPIDRLSSDDAEFVDCIYTSPVLGINKPIGTVNYFANGGALQPSCALADDNELLFGTCSHLVAIDYYVKALQSENAYPASYCPFLTLFTYFTNDTYCDRRIDSYMSTKYSKRPIPGSYYVHVL